MRAVGTHNGNIIYSPENETMTATMLDAVISAGFPSPAQDYLEEEIDLAKLFNLTSPGVCSAGGRGFYAGCAHS